MAQEIDVEDDLNMDDGMDEMPNLFWHMDVTTNGDEIEPPEVPGWIIHITNACFGANVKTGSRTVVISQDKDGKESPLCVLLEGKNENVRLDLLFSEPAKLILKGKNSSPVSLTGYLQPPPGFGDEAPSMMSDDDDIDIDDEGQEQLRDLIRKRKLSQAQKDAEEDEAPELIEEKEEKNSTKVAEPQTKRAKLEKAKNDKSPQQQQSPQQPPQQQQQQQQPKKTPNPKQNQPKNANAQKKVVSPPKEVVSPPKEAVSPPKEAVSPPKEAVSPPKENDGKKQTSEKKEATTTSEKKEADKKDKMSTLKGGIQYKDLKQGEGNQIQVGQKVQIYYVGQLGDKKIFDKVISGQAFSFEFGKSAVVKGLDMGMKGMKIGGKRRIVVPAKLGYGEKGTEAVPPNSVLTYTVEVKSAE